MMLIPATLEIDGKPEQVTLECAGAIARIAGKLLYLYAYVPHEEGGDTVRVRAALDGFADRAIALNRQP